jgi:hypothetical protein
LLLGAITVWLLSIAPGATVLRLGTVEDVDRTIARALAEDLCRAVERRTAEPCQTGTGGTGSAPDALRLRVFGGASVARVILERTTAAKTTSVAADVPLDPKLWNTELEGVVDKLFAAHAPSGTPIVIADAPPVEPSRFGRPLFLVSAGTAVIAGGLAAYFGKSYLDTQSWLNTKPMYLVVGSDFDAKKSDYRQQGIATELCVGLAIGAALVALGSLVLGN